MPAPFVALAEFVIYVGKHPTGAEKGEAADFLHHLFRALGHGSVKEAGANRESRVAKKGGGKGKNFIDSSLTSRAAARLLLSCCMRRATSFQ